MTRFIPLMMLVLAACGPSPESVSDTKIVGGEPVATGEMPAVVGLAFGAVGAAEYVAQCTGTLIAPTFVLTAGHCVEGKQDVVVYTGEGQDDARVPVAEAHAVKNKTVHAELRRYPLGYGDFALLELAAPLEGVEPLPVVTTLAERLAATVQGETLLVGYGRREDDRAGRKFQAEATIQSVGPAEAIVGGDGKDACAGDSGGPALTRRADGSLAVLGVVSRGLKLTCGAGGFVGLTSDVACWLAVTAGLPAPTECEMASATAARRISQRHVMQAFGFSSWKEAEAELSRKSELALDGLMLPDVSVLAKLTRLESLSVTGNRIKSIAPLRHLRKLKTLKIDGNVVEDLEALAEQEARGLLIYGKRRQHGNYFATDFLRLCQDPATPEAARKTIKAVMFTTMTEDCDQANERLLLLSTLRLRDRPLTDVSPLAGLENLKQLDLSNTDVTDLSPLAPLIARGLVVTGVSP
jgi:V8-like Glu-specific endopeptidase